MNDENSKLNVDEQVKAYKLDAAQEPIHIQLEKAKNAAIGKLGLPSPQKFITIYKDKEVPF